MIWGLGFGVWRFGIGVWGLGFGVWGQDLLCTVWGFRFAVEGAYHLQFMVAGFGFRVSGLEFMFQFFRFTFKGLGLKFIPSGK